MKDSIKYQSMLCLLLATLVGCSTPEPNPRPQDDYYTYINKEWLENTEIPENLPGLDNIAQLTLDLNGQVRAALDKMDAGGQTLQPYEQKLLDFYRSYMNTGLRNELGIKAIEPEMAIIDKCQDHKSLALAFAELQNSGIGGPFVIPVTTDPVNSTQYLITVMQYGLGLPQTVLAGEDESSQALRGLYREHMANLFELAGMDNPTDRSAAVLALEQELAKIQWSAIDNRDPRKTYNRYTMDQFKTTLSNFPISDMLAILGFKDEAELVVRQPSYLETLNQLFVSTDLNTWKDYLRMQLLSERASVLSDAFIEEGAAYRAKQGMSPSDLEQWSKAILFLQDQVDMMVGRVYVDHYFDDEKMAQITEIVNEIKKEYRTAISESTFFSDATKNEALNKLDNMTFFVGYPEKWKDYSGLEIDAADLAGNVRRVAQFNQANLAGLLGSTVDPEEWAISPSQVNAVYQPSANRFIMMAAFLQQPYFDSKWSKAENMGSIGYVIGHEIGHGFDDQGSQYDANGNIRNWWAEEDKQKFIELAQKIIAQADAYEIIPGHFLNGRLEIGEILGDLNGLHISHRAMERIAQEEGLNLEEANRQYFERAGRSWRSKLREATLLKFLETDGHPPGEFRVNGIYPHLDAFHELYNTQPGDSMYLAPEDRISMW